MISDPNDMISRYTAINTAIKAAQGWYGKEQSMELDFYIEECFLKLPVVDAVTMEWLNEKEQTAERDVFYCKGDAKKNVEIMHAIRVIKELIHDEMEAE